MQLAEQLSVALQAVARYQASRLRLLVSTLAKHADMFDVSVEDLVGTSAKRKAGKRRLAKIQQQLERVAASPKTQQRVIAQLLDSILAAQD